MILRAIVFEPDEIVREFLLLVLNNRGYEYFTFERAGVCAMDLEAGWVSPPGRQCADIIIADVNHHGFPSFETLGHVDQGNCKVPNIALMSGSWLDVHRSWVENLDCIIFDKPFEASRLNLWLDECEKRIHPNRKLYNGFWVDSRRNSNPWKCDWCFIEDFKVFKIE